VSAGRLRPPPRCRRSAALTTIVIAGLLSATEAARPVDANDSLVPSAAEDGAGMAPAEGDAALLPPDGAVASWRRVGLARVYAGPELYEYIDGGAEVFYELGFERVTVQRYADREDEMAVELYAMRDPAAALGIYLLKVGPAPGPAGQRATTTPGSGLADRHTAGRHQLMLVRDRYVLIVDNLSGKAERAPALLEFARQVASGLPPAGRVEVLDLLPLEDLVQGSERIIRGPLGLQAFILLGEGDVLRLDGRTTAVAARYGGASLGPHALLVAPYADAEGAMHALTHVEGHLDPEIQLLSRSDTRLVFRDYSGRFGVVAVAGPRLVLTLGLERRPEP